MTHNRFVQLLWDKWLQYNVECEFQNPEDDKSSCMQLSSVIHIDSLDEIEIYGRKQGWLEEQDVLWGDKEIERRHVARIIHQFLKIEKKEKDEIDWQVAMKLQDLFDCRACVNHVAQVYTKGIMKEYSPLVFGMYESIDEKQAEGIIERALDSKLRHKENSKSLKDVQNLKNLVDSNNIQDSIDLKDSVSDKSFVITYEDALSIMKSQDEYILIDVRNEEDYKEWHLENAINIPVIEITTNPMTLDQYKDKVILLYCKKGYNSEIAARGLISKGYKKVFSFGTE